MRLRAFQDVEGGRKTGYITQKSRLGYNGAVLDVTRCRGCARETREENANDREGMGRDSWFWLSTPRSADALSIILDEI